MPKYNGYRGLGVVPWAAILAAAGESLPYILEAIKGNKDVWDKKSESEKEAYVDNALILAFENAAEIGDSPMNVFWSIMARVELQDDYLTWLGKNSWVERRIAKGEEKYGMVFEDVPQNPFIASIFSLNGVIWVALGLTAIGLTAKIVKKRRKKS